MKVLSMRLSSSKSSGYVVWILEEVRLGESRRTRPLNNWSMPESTESRNSASCRSDRQGLATMTSTLAHGRTSRARKLDACSDFGFVRKVD